MIISIDDGGDSSSEVELEGEGSKALVSTSIIILPSRK
jgi:hypothetical protein